MGLHCCVGTRSWALPFSSREPLATEGPPYKGNQRSAESPTCVPPHTVILPSGPRSPGVGEELPGKQGLGQVLAFLNFRDSHRKEGDRLFSPVSHAEPQGPMLASLAGNPGGPVGLHQSPDWGSVDFSLLLTGRGLRAFQASPAHPRPSGHRASRDLYLQDPAKVGRSEGVRRCLRQASV